MRWRRRRKWRRKRKRSSLRMRVAGGSLLQFQSCAGLVALCLLAMTGTSFVFAYACAYC
jgi:hypothetical protein